MSNNEETQCCGNCIFWWVKGVCRRYPSSINGKRADDWCGEWGGIQNTGNLDKPARDRPQGKWWTRRRGR